MVTISDTGRGIPAGEEGKGLRQILQGSGHIGHRAGFGARSFHSKGSGRAARGKITLESEAGKGSVFKVILPKKDKKD